MTTLYIALGLIAGFCFVFCIIFTICKKISLDRAKRNHTFEYSKGNKVVTQTGIDILDKILSIYPDFKNKELEKTNLRLSNRVNPQTQTPITLAETYKLYPEEKTRLNCYYQCLKKFGHQRVDVEFPIQGGSRTYFTDVVVFHKDKENPQQSAEHSQQNLQFIFECKKSHANPNRQMDGKPENMDWIMKKGTSQLHTYMSLCPNLREITINKNGQTQKILKGAGCITNGVTSIFYKTYIDDNTHNFAFTTIPTPSWYE